MSDAENRRSRRTLVRDAVASGTAVAGASVIGMPDAADAGNKKHKKKNNNKSKKPNVVLFLSDQERKVQHFPEGWAAANLPAQERLRKNGVTFNNAFCSACQCSPSRASLFTGMFPAQHGVVDVQTFDFDPASANQPGLPLPEDLPNLATIMADAGYDVAYKGKWHMSKPASWEAPGDSVEWKRSDVSPYGFRKWNAPDAGDQAGPEHVGAGTADNDGRYMFDEQEGVIEFIQSRKGKDKPFCLIVSLVNPHDVTEFPGIGDQWVEDGFDESWLASTGIEFPPNYIEDLAANGKPNAQQALPAQLNFYLGAFTDEDQKIDYLNFYGNLMKVIDGYIGDTVRALKDAGHYNNTLFIRTSDHGEMGLSHGGLRQKTLQAYEETLRVPLVYVWPDELPAERPAMPWFPMSISCRRSPGWSAPLPPPLARTGRATTIQASSAIPAGPAPTTTCSSPMTMSTAVSRSRPMSAPTTSSVTAMPGTNSSAIATRRRTLTPTSGSSTTFRPIPTR